MSNPVRTKDEVLREVRYHERLHFLHCRFYRSIRKCLVIFSLASGSAALTPALQSLPAGVITAAGLVALFAILDAVGNYSEKAVWHNVWRRNASLVLAKSGPLTQEELEAADRELIAEVDEEIEALRVVAWNDVLKTVGREDAMRLETRFQRLMRTLA